MENIKEIQNENIQMTNTEKLTNENKRSTLFKYYSKDSIIKYGDIIIDYVVRFLMNNFLGFFFFFLF